MINQMTELMLSKSVIGEEHTIDTENIKVDKIFQTHNLPACFRSSPRWHQARRPRSSSQFWTPESKLTFRTISASSVLKTAGSVLGKLGTLVFQNEL